MNASITLSALQALIRQGIDRAHPLPYWVTAEISESKVNASGHCYLELVEKGGANHVPRARVSAVIWRNHYAMLSSYFVQATGQALTAGMQVLVKVIVSYHELYGLSLQITDIDPTYTLGDMERQRQETIRRLQEDGVYTMNRELSFPLVMQRIAVISSSKAAGYQDFMKELSAGVYRMEVTLFDAVMQGAGAEESIVRALEAVADQADRFDGVVLIRGGGSQSDLGCFNSYRLCFYLAQFPLPILTGIGHDKDQSVADLVAVASLKTPTAVAVFLKNEMAEFESHLDGVYREVVQHAAQTLTSRREALRQQALQLHRVATLSVRQPRIRIAQMQSQLYYAAQALLRQQGEWSDRQRVALQRNAQSLVTQQQQQLNEHYALLRSRSRECVQSHTKILSLWSNLVATHDPQRIMDLGFAVIRTQTEIVTDPAALHPGASIEIQMKRQQIMATVERIAPMPTTKSRYGKE